MALDKVPGPFNLYIGGMMALYRSQAIKNANITHIVSALRLSGERPDLFAPYKHLEVELDDMDDEDIVQHFPRTNQFIQEGLDGGGGVLVHCAMGKSRSATVAIAYMLSRDPSLTPSSALDLLRTSRPIVEPNPGFWKQLLLYHAAGCPQNVAEHPAYQRWLYQQQVEASVACGRAPDTIRFEDEEQSSQLQAQAKAPAQAQDQTQATAFAPPKLEIRCRKCRRPLATSDFIVSHEAKQPPPPPSVSGNAHIPFSEPISSIEEQKQQQDPPNNTATTTPASPSTNPLAQNPPSSSSSKPPCAHIFLDPLSWMRPELEQGKLDGKLECPNARCGGNVGRYAWQGLRCSCGRWVVPGIALARSRVDEVKKVDSNSGGRATATTALGQRRVGVAGGKI